jgi:osmotically inducible protein OsmC
MPARNARTNWTGDLQSGTGKVELTSSGLGTYDVSFPKRAADEADGTTSPEELIAAAHSACFSMALSKQVADAGGTDATFDVTAKVTLGKDAGGASAITAIAVTVRGSANGIDAARFQQAAEAAKAGCPVSKALAGVSEITLDASFA